MKKTILVWEQDIIWFEQLQRLFEKEGVWIREADGMELLQQILAEQSCIAAVLSLELFLEECSEGAWQEELGKICKSFTGGLFLLSGHQESSYEMAALQAGAADYINREKGISIAFMRLKKGILGQRACLRPNTVYPDIYEELSCGAVQIGQERIALTPKEAVVFHCLVRSQGELISREEILRAGWGEKLPDCKRVVDTVIKQLRGKLKETQYVIRSKYKLGYLLEKQ